VSDTLQSKEQALWQGCTRKEHFLELAKPRVRVRVQECGEGRPALFIHGVMTAGSSFAPLAMRMKGVRCLVLDRPGCGLSEPWSLDGPTFRNEAVAVIAAVLDALDLPTVDLVGSSLGALWSTWFAIDRPDRLERLALVGPSAGMPGVRVPMFLRLLSVVLGRVVVRKPMTDKMLRRIFVDMGHGPSIERGLIPGSLFEWGVAMANETSTRSNELQVLQRAVGLRGMRPWARLRSDELEKVKSPTLLLAGDGDTHGGPPVAARLADLIPGAIRETVRGAGHLPWLDDADGVAERLSAFLASCSRLERVEEGDGASRAIT
jgi:2-hydroxy-6-oxonona-2,4-dienedioate hydrolase